MRVLTENTVFTHALVIRTIEDSINEQAMLMFLNSLSYFWKKMAESVRLKCLFQTNQYTLSPFNLSLKYLSYFCLNYILQAVVTLQFQYYSSMAVLFPVCVCLRETTILLPIFSARYIYNDGVEYLDMS